MHLQSWPFRHWGPRHRLDFFGRHFHVKQLGDALARSAGTASTKQDGKANRNLAIELNPERVILRGQASSYYLKQLAQHGIQECLPDLSLENSIVVDRAFAR